MTFNCSDYLEYSGIEEDMVGKDPRKLTEEDLQELPHERSPVAAIREKCLDCCHTKQEVKYCISVSCPLWPFRMGKNVFVKRSMTEEQRNASSERLKKARESKK